MGVGRTVGLTAALLAAARAGADVKAGVEAWTRGDWAVAVAQWRGPAAAGDPDAEFDLGQAYKLGRGVAPDAGAATEWFRRAAVQGHAQAADDYALALFRSGRRAEALPWLEKAAARDERRAELVLGTMVFNGDGVGKDWVRAYALVLRSSRQGVDGASRTLAQMDGYVQPAQREQGVALAARIVEGARMARLAGPNFRDAPPQAAVGARDVARADPSRTTAPSETRTARAASTPHPATGRFRIQLGAFRDPANARALWAKIGPRIGGSPSYVAAGGITRLRAGPFTTRTDAERACRASGTACAVIGG